MRELTPEQQEHCARLPEYRRADYCRRAARMTDKERLMESIAWGAGAAWLALKAGESHPRIITKTVAQRKVELNTHRMASEAAHYPKQPQIIVTKPVETYLDYTDRRHGAGGAERQE